MAGQGDPPISYNYSGDERNFKLPHLTTTSMQPRHQQHVGISHSPGVPARAASAMGYQISPIMYNMAEMPHQHPIGHPSLSMFSQGGRIFSGDQLPRPQSTLGLGMHRTLSGSPGVSDDGEDPSVDGGESRDGGGTVSDKKKGGGGQRKKLKWTFDKDLLLVKALLAYLNAAVERNMLDRIERPLGWVADLLKRFFPEYKIEVVRNRVKMRVFNYALTKLFSKIPGTQKFRIHVDELHHANSHLADAVATKKCSYWKLQFAESRYLDVDAFFRECTSELLDTFTANDTAAKGDKKQRVNLDDDDTFQRLALRCSVDETIVNEAKGVNVGVAQKAEGGLEVRVVQSRHPSPSPTPQGEEEGLVGNISKGKETLVRPRSPKEETPREERQRQRIGSAGQERSQLSRLSPVEGDEREDDKPRVSPGHGSKSKEGGKRRKKKYFSSSVDDAIPIANARARRAAEAKVAEKAERVEGWSASPTTHSTAGSGSGARRLQPLVQKPRSPLSSSEGTVAQLFPSPDDANGGHGLGRSGKNRLSLSPVPLLKTRPQSANPLSQVEVPALPIGECKGSESGMRMPVDEEENGYAASRDDGEEVLLHRSRGQSRSTATVTASPPLTQLDLSKLSLQKPISGGDSSAPSSAASGRSSSTVTSTPKKVVASAADKEYVVQQPSNRSSGGSSRGRESVVSTGRGSSHGGSYREHSNRSSGAGFPVFPSASQTSYFPFGVGSGCGSFRASDDGLQIGAEGGFVMGGGTGGDSGSKRDSLSATAADGTPPRQYSGMGPFAAVGYMGSPFPSPPSAVGPRFYPLPAGSSPHASVHHPFSSSFPHQQLPNVVGGGQGGSPGHAPQYAALNLQTQGSGSSLLSSSSSGRGRPSHVSAASGSRMSMERMGSQTDMMGSMDDGRGSVASNLSSGRSGYGWPQFDHGDSLRQSAIAHSVQHSQFSNKGSNAPGLSPQQHETRLRQVPERFRPEQKGENSSHQSP
uniref:Uncharacterized protein n=1 Tax=Palpitomonas bilix TaxID=652834 RepID=A0A7S3GK84_9EUKA|mmetsp:Transcript_7119/g.18391  ORF Transcript_7119/g.18391 Transcript_7119/m.18391 type:complete len:982 (+) Transcript_7119:391-3336(+)